MKLFAASGETTSDMVTNDLVTSSEVLTPPKAGKTSKLFWNKTDETNQ
jgi:hypothetical protein